MYIHRVLEKTILRHLKAFPVVGITGPRQSGKSTMLKHLLAKNYRHVTFDDYRMLNLLHEDPEKFMRIYNNRVIFDEIQKAPELFDMIKLAVDNDRKNYGKFILTGSAQFLFLKGVSESLAGRISLLSLLPFEITEMPETRLRDSVFRGGYPELVINKYRESNDWYSTYIETYLQRDLRALLNVGDLRDFRRLIQLLAGRCAQILNYSEFAKELGITVATVKHWISALEASYIIFLLPPFYQNFGKRIVKAPKLYFYDIGLVSYLLGITSRDIFERSSVSGALFENYIVSEIHKREIHNKTNSELYYFRSNYGMEVDIILDRRISKEWIEIKSSETFRPAMTENISKLKSAVERGYLIYNGADMEYTDNIKIMNYRSYFRK